MDISINEQNQEHIQRKVKAGHGTPDEVIAKALRLLDERDQKLEALRQDIQEGLDSGPGRLLDDTFVEDVKRRGRARIAQQDTSE